MERPRSIACIVITKSNRDQARRLRFLQASIQTAVLAFGFVPGEATHSRINTITDS